MSHDISKIVDSVVKEVMEKGTTAVKKPTHAPLAKMTLAAAKELIEAVEKKAAEMGVKAVVAVSDAGGNTIAVECMDDAYIASFDIAVNKAFTVVSLKMPTKNLAELAAPGGSLYGIQFTNNGRIVIFGGGEPLMKEGKVMGGLGVSGGTAEQDTLLGEYGRDYFVNHLL
ncbi:MAG: heme-binding protein [Clostridia bacterium]|nr:heme-binding protein [Clostridia bacterium]